jgi:hypothetical protein
MDAARRACELAPGNVMYRELLDQIQSGARSYESAGEQFGYRAVTPTTGRWCLSIFLINLLLRLCCGRGVFCC